MFKYAEKLFKIIKGEFKTEVGKINIYFGILLCVVFGVLEVKSSILQSILKSLSHEKVSNTTGKFLISIIVFFLLSLCIVAFIESKSRPRT